MVRKSSASERRDSSPSSHHYDNVAVSSRSGSSDDTEPWDEGRRSKLATKRVSQPAKSSGLLFCVDELFDPLDLGDDEPLDDGDLPSLSRGRSRSRDASTGGRVVNGQWTTKKPMSPPSQAGLVSPRGIGDTKTPSMDSSQTDNYDDDVPDDERAHLEHDRQRSSGDRHRRTGTYADEIDIETMDSDEQNLCDYTLQSMGNMCGSPSGDTENKQIVPQRITRRIQRDEFMDAEEQTAIEVEYVDPKCGQAPPDSMMVEDDEEAKEEEKSETDNDFTSQPTSAWSPQRKNAYLAAMARKAKEDFDKKQQKINPTTSAKKSTNKDDKEEDSDNIYNSFTATEKRKFLKHINSGMAPTESCAMILEEREKRQAQDLAESKAANIEKGETKSHRFKFWKKGSKTNEDEKNKSGKAVAIVRAAATLGNSAAVAATLDDVGESDINDETPLRSGNTGEKKSTPDQIDTVATAEPNKVNLGEELDISESQLDEYTPPAGVIYTEKPVLNEQTMRSIEIVESVVTLQQAVDKVETKSAKNSEEKKDEYAYNPLQNSLTRPMTGVVAILGSSNKLESDGPQNELPASGSNFYDAVRVEHPDDFDSFGIESIPKSQSKRGPRLASLRISPRAQGFSSMGEKEKEIVMPLTEPELVDHQIVKSTAGVPVGRRRNKPSPEIFPISPQSDDGRRRILGVPIPGSKRTGFATLDDEGDSGRDSILAMPQQLGIRDSELDDLEKILLRPAMVMSAVSDHVDEEEDGDHQEDGFNLKTPKLTAVIQDNENKADMKDMDVSLDKYLSSTCMYSSGPGQDHMSVVSGKSGWTAATGMTGSSSITQSSRKRRPGAAKGRLAKAKEAEKLVSVNKGWHKSIMASATNCNAAWDPESGFVDYKDIPVTLLEEDMNSLLVNTDKKLRIHLNGASASFKSDNFENQSSRFIRQDTTSIISPVASVSIPFDGKATTSAKRRQTAKSINMDPVFTETIPISTAKWDSQKALLGLDRSRSIDSSLNVLSIATTPDDTDCASASTLDPDSEKHSAVHDVNLPVHDDIPLSNAESSLRVSATKVELQPRQLDKELAAADALVGAIPEFPRSGGTTLRNINNTKSSFQDIHVSPSNDVLAQNVNLEYTPSDTVQPLQVQTDLGGVQDTKQTISGIQMNDKSPLNSWIQKSGNVPISRSELSTEGSDEAVASSAQEKYVQLSDNGSVRSFAKDPTPTIPLPSRKKMDPPTMADASPSPMNKPSGILTTWIEDGGKDVATEDDTVPLLSSGKAFQRSSDERAPSVQVVKHKCDEDDVNLFAPDAKAVLDGMSVDGGQALSPGRGSGPVDLDDSVALSDSDDDDEGWGSDSFLQGIVANNLFSSTEKSKIPEAPVPKLNKPSRDSSPMRERVVGPAPNASPTEYSITIPDNHSLTVASVAEISAAETSRDEGQTTSTTLPFRPSYALKSSKPAPSERISDILVSRELPDLYTSASNDTDVSTPSAVSSSVKLRAQQWETMSGKSITSGKMKSETSPVISPIQNSSIEAPGRFADSSHHIEVAWPESLDEPARVASPTGSAAAYKTFLGKKVRAESAAAARKEETQKIDPLVLERIDPVNSGQGPPRLNLIKPSENDIDDDSLFEFQSTSDNGGRRTTRTHPLLKSDASIGSERSGSELSDGAFPDISPIQTQDEDDSVNEGNRNTGRFESVSDTGTDIEQSSFLKRLSACAAPILPRQFTQMDFIQDSVPMAHLAFLKTNPPVTRGTAAPSSSRSSGRYIPPSLCGRPETILEDGKEGTSPHIQSLSKVKYRSSPLGQSLTNEFRSSSSVVSGEFGARTSYLDSLAMRAAVADPKRSGSRSRSRGKVRSASSDVSTSSMQSSERWKEFLERKSQAGSSPGQSRSSTDISKAAEKYAAEKVEEMMEAMLTKSSGRQGGNTQRVDAMIENLAGVDTSGQSLPAYDLMSRARSSDTRSSSKSKRSQKSDSAKAAEKLAAARVEAMMAAMTSSNLDEGEI